MKKTEAIELLKLQISNAEFYARYTNNDKDAEEELKNAEAFSMAIEALSSNAIQVVQCKDCKHRETDDCPMYWVEWSMFEDCDGYTDNNYIVHDYTTDDGYCNYGERK